MPMRERIVDGEPLHLIAVIALLHKAEDFSPRGRVRASDCELGVWAAAGDEEAEALRGRGVRVGEGVGVGADAHAGDVPAHCWRRLGGVDGGFFYRVGLGVFGFLLVLRGTFTGKLTDGSSV